MRQASPHSERDDVLREILPSVQSVGHREIDRIPRAIEGDDVAKPK